MGELWAQTHYVGNHYLLSTGQESFIEEGGTVKNVIDDSLGNPHEGYIVEGTGETGQLETVNNAFSLSDDYAVTSQPTQVGQTDPATGNTYVLEQTFLQNKASNTVSNQDQLYTNFPSSSTGFSPGVDARDPIEYFLNNLNN